MIHAKIFFNDVVGATEEDQRALDEMFPDGEVHLNSDNCPEVAALIEEQSALLLEQNREAYEALARL